jgi:hypothetical protein
MHKASIYCVFIVLASFFTENAFSQKVDINKATIEDAEWNQGTIMLTDGKTITGLVKLNTKTGLLGYESGANSKSFTARNVIGFEFFDAVENRKRSFLSVDYKDAAPKDDGAFAALKKSKQKTVQETGIPQFFEILVECKTFALLSTVGQLHITTSAGNEMGVSPGTGIPIYPSSPSTTYSQTETLLIFDADGVVTPLLDITSTETDRLIFDDARTKTKKLDNSIIEKYTTPHFEQLKEYAKERKLSFKKRDDLVQILEQYKSISSD